MSSPTGRNTAGKLDFKGFRPGEVIRLIPDGMAPPIRHRYRPGASVKGINFSELEARFMARMTTVCSACGEAVLCGLIVPHCRVKGDDVHLALEVLVS